jgi:hypothetical protein
VKNPTYSRKRFACIASGFALLYLTYRLQKAKYSNVRVWRDAFGVALDPIGYIPFSV